MSYLLDEKVDVYKTSEFSLICALVYSGFSIIGFEYKPDDKGRVFSIFHKTNDLDKTVADYWNRNTRVEPIQFWQISREIKARMKNEPVSYGQ
jgi:hypothetical protein